MLQRFSVRFYYGWLIVAVLAVANFTQVGEFNPVLAVFVKPFGNDFGWSRAEVALAITLGSFAGGLVGPIFGPVIDRYGTRVMLTSCQLVYGSCLLSLTFLQGSLVQFVATYGLGRTVVQGGAALAGQAIIANWFNAKRGKAMATSTLGTLIGQSALPAMVAYISETWHWRYAWLMLGLSTLVLAAPPTVLFLRRRPRRPGPAARRRNAATGPIRQCAGSGASRPRHQQCRLDAPASGAQPQFLVPFRRVFLRVLYGRRHQSASLSLPYRRRALRPTRGSSGQRLFWHWRHGVLGLGHAYGPVPFARLSGY